MTLVVYTYRSIRFISGELRKILDIIQNGIISKAVFFFFFQSKEKKTKKQHNPWVSAIHMIYLLKGEVF